MPLMLNSHISLLHSLSLGLLLCSQAIPASAALTDLSVELLPNGPAYLAPGQRRDVDIIIRNHGPDTAFDPVAINSEFLGAPVSDVVIVPADSGTPCPLQYTDFVTPAGQSLFLSFFGTPPIPAGQEYRCRQTLIAVARRIQFYNFHVSAQNISADATDPDLANNVQRFQFSFVVALQLDGLSGTGVLVLIVGMLASASSRGRASAAH